ncbi:MAG: MBL fold metallo-hydrolase [Acidobacteria bacterium]|nr:MBL fold metallo-hydrolase [Acidobacteriota bacterium]MSO61409.1 MBL fold metallo-hydrolase [Acidobacteriota bacterium]
MSSSLIIGTAAAGPFQKNGYVLGCERTKEAVYIDPGDEVAQLLGFIAEQGLTVTHILLTHAHVDHVSGVAEAKRTLHAPICLHRADQSLYDNAARQGAMFGIQVEQPPPVDRYYEAAAPLTFGDYAVEVHHTPGHAPGGVCLAVSKAGETAPPALFAGDNLFAGSIGRTDLPGGDYEVLMKAITEVLFAFPDESIVYSGHGHETTIGRERRTNPFVLEYLAAR